jgi:hypothetical protein
MNHSTVEKLKVVSFTPSGASMTLVGLEALIVGLSA